MDPAKLLNDLCSWADHKGIRVARDVLKPEQAGQFDGRTVTLNVAYPSEDLAFYLAHALGSIVLWSLNREAIQNIFNDLRAAKENRTDTARLERAIEAYRAFETETSELGAGLLAELGYPVASYSNFMRADLEALTHYHRTGKLPVWHDFFTQWNNEVAAGSRKIMPLPPKPVPAFTPPLIESQEILQRQS